VWVPGVDRATVGSEPWRGSLSDRILIAVKPVRCAFTVAVGRFALDAVSRSGRLKGVTGFPVSACLPKTGAPLSSFRPVSLGRRNEIATAAAPRFARVKASSGEDRCAIACRKPLAPLSSFHPCHRSPLQRHPGAPARILGQGPSGCRSANCPGETIWRASWMGFRSSSRQTCRTCSPAAARPQVATGGLHRGTVFETYLVGRQRVEI